MCPDGERGTPGQPCHYIDTGLADTTEFLMARGDLDAMCYACICTLTNRTMRQALETHLEEQPTYLDQCYATSASTVFDSSSDADACAAADLSDRANAKDRCEAAAACTYRQSEVESYCEEMDAVVADASLWGYVATVIVVVPSPASIYGIFMCRVCM